MTTGAGPAQDIVQKFIDEEEENRKKKLHVALQVQWRVVCRAPVNPTPSSFALAVRGTDGLASPCGLGSAVRGMWQHVAAPLLCAIIAFWE